MDFQVRRDHRACGRGLSQNVQFSLT
jgi:hypothetical protein